MTKGPFHRCRNWWKLQFQLPLVSSSLVPSWISRGIAMCVLFLAISWFYIHLLVRHGTISPIATALYTTPFAGRTASDYPPPSWRAPFRVVVSLTTTPSRLNKVMDSVNSLFHQSYQPDQIYVHIPKGPMKRSPTHSYDEIDIPTALIALAPRVYINRCIDDGPATKLLGALRLEQDPNTLIITVDDDFIYPFQLIEALTWEAQAKPQDVLGICGWGIMGLPWHSVGAVPAYVPYFMRPTGRYIDILQACCGNAYRRGFFNNIDALADIPKVCITVDDVWIAGYLQTIEHRQSAILSKRLDPIDPLWKEQEQQSMTAKKMKLSEYNHQHQVHYKCIQAIESKFDTVWIRNYQQQALIMHRNQRYLRHREEDYK